MGFFFIWILEDGFLLLFNGVSKDSIVLVKNQKILTFTVAIRNVLVGTFELPTYNWDHSFGGGSMDITLACEHWTSGFGWCWLSNSDQQMGFRLKKEWSYGSYLRGESHLLWWSGARTVQWMRLLVNNSYRLNQLQSNITKWLSCNNISGQGKHNHQIVKEYLYQH